MGKIRFDSDIVSGQIVQLKEAGKALKDVSEMMTLVSSCLNWKISSADLIHRRIDDYVKYVQSLENATSHLEEALEEISECYRNTERRLAENKQWNTISLTDDGEPVENKGGWDPFQFIRGLFHKENKEKYEVDSVVFDDKGKYGGDQGSAKGKIFGAKKELYDTVRKYHPEWNDKQIKKFLVKLNSEGCGYVAIANTIFMQYEGKEDEFKKKFGFDMYAKNGDLNYDQLIVDFYTATDNHWQDDEGNDFIYTEEDKSDVVGWGTIPESQKYRAELYLKEKGVNVNVQLGKEVTIKNYEELSKEGEVIINYHFGYIYDEKGKKVQFIEKGHSMTVTGVTDDGKFIVSSWGKKLYVDPDEIIDKNGKRTHFDFVYYQYG